MTPLLEIIAQDNNLCGEGPLWDPARGRMLWDDNESSLVYQLDLASGEKTIISRGLMVSGIALNRDGNLVFGGFTGLHLWRKQDDYCTLVSEYDGETLFINDILADPRGRVYAGTLYWGENGMEKPGKLYCINPDASVHVVDEGIELANGLGLSPDNRTLYFADSAARRIYAYDVDLETGSLANRQLFVQVPGDEGIPDGLTVDVEGFVWSAQWYGGQAVRYDPEGKVERCVAMPVKQVSSLAFGGPNLTDLYITTAGAHWPSKLMPPGYEVSDSNVGGSFYRLRLDIRGKVEHQANLSWPA